MPKDRKVNPSSSNQTKVSPYTGGGSRDLIRNKLETSSPPSLDEREWEEAKCPICMEHPHNAVLLSCSSREKGCRPYMCDTSYRHSNCFDQFRKLSLVADSRAHPDDESVTWMLYRNGGGRQTSLQSNSSPGGQALELLCPLCRGQINGWVVIEAARKYMNAKVRSCSMESCDFTGNYAELRKHARCKHPSVRPSEADPQRQSDWSRLERQRDFEDTLSAYQSQFGSDLDGDDPFELYDLYQDDDPFEEQWLPGALFDDIFSGIHSESEDGQSEDFNTLIDLHPEVEFSFSFLNDLSFCPWDDGRSFGSARTSSSLLNRRSTRSGSSPANRRETSSRSRNATAAPSRHTPNSSQRSSSRSTATSRHTPSSSRQRQLDGRR